MRVLPKFCTLLVVTSVLLYAFPSAARVAQKVQDAVVSAHPIASAAGQNILAQGGNAFDAAVAISSTLSVVEPMGSGLGGGGFWLMYDAEKDEYRMLDARETAPLAAYQDMYLDEQGDVVKGASREGPLAAGIPGLPMAFDVMTTSYGTLDLKQNLAPAIEAAENGFAVEARYVMGIDFKKDLLKAYDQSAAIFLDNGDTPKEGWVLKQADLANTLRQIAEDGADGFYKGALAQEMVRAVTEAGGIWTLQDLAEYKTIWRKPMTIEFQNAKITMASLPSSGGLVMGLALNILSGFNLTDAEGSARSHLIIEAMRRAYLERAKNMGDPDFVTVDAERILSKAEAERSRATIVEGIATPSMMLWDFMKPPEEDTEPTQIPEAEDKGTETTHFAVVDKDGNWVAVTQSINFWFGSGFVAGNTGVILNNEMDDFSIKPGVENGYGLIGGAANAIAPGKRMLSSMTPTFVETDKGFALIGTPGGSRIITMNMLAVLNWLDGMSAEDIVRAPRFHHQFHPDTVIYEDGAFSEETISDLENIGHSLEKSDRPYGNMQVITFDKMTGDFETASDPRGDPAYDGVRVY